MEHKKRKYRTDYLFSTPIFLVGSGSAFNLSGNYYDFNLSKSPQKADYDALASDWYMTGYDIEDTLAVLKSESNSSDKAKESK